MRDLAAPVDTLPAESRALGKEKGQDYVFTYAGKGLEHRTSL